MGVASLVGAPAKAAWPQETPPQQTSSSAAAQVAAAPSSRHRRPLLPQPWTAAQRRAQHVLNANGPPAWPSLSHQRWAFNFEFLTATSTPTDVFSGAPLASNAFAYSGRWLIEMPLYKRAWFVGMVHNVAAASVPSGSSPTSGGNTWVLGNPELWLRGLWTSELGLAAGGGLGIVVPLPRSFSNLESEVVRAIRVVRADSYPHFQDLTITFRPYLDVRHVVGPVVLQVRQGLDVGVVARDLREDENRYDLSAVTMVYAGVTLAERVVLGLEAQEVYQITADVSSPTCSAPCDEHRAQLSLSPSLRLKNSRLSPSLSVLFPLSTPLRREVSSFAAARLNLDATF